MANWANGYFVMFLVASILYGVILSTGAILLEEYTFSRYSSIGQLLKLTLYGIIENFGYRQLTVLFRVEGMIRFKKNKENWGKIQRKSFESK